MAFVAPQGICPSQSRPDAEKEHHRHNGERPEQEDQHIERDTRRTLGYPRLAEGGDRREDGGHTHGCRCADQRHRQARRHAQRHELATTRPEGRHRRVVLALDHALSGQGLAHHGQSDEGGERSEDPPADGLGMNRGGDRSRGRILTLRTLHSRRP